jgi:hypothetical protein
MKKTLLAMVLAAATMPLTFAGQANPPVSQKPATAATKSKKKMKTTKKHMKHVKKGAAKTTTNATPQK